MKKIYLNKKNIYFLGDTHTLYYAELLKKYDLKDFCLIHLGDSGEGVAGKEVHDNYNLQNLFDYCKENNGIILTVRGNHSNPSYYKPGHFSEKYNEYIKFIPDYTQAEINGKSFLFVGGAVSIDRGFNVKDVDYWEDEIVQLPNGGIETLPQNIDCLVSHTSPCPTFPFATYSNIKYYLKNDVNLEKDLNTEKVLMKSIYDWVQPKLSIFGHFHVSCVLYSSDRTRLYRCLGVNHLYHWNIQ